MRQGAYLGDGSIPFKHSRKISQTQINKFIKKKKNNKKGSKNGTKKIS